MLGLLQLSAADIAAVREQVEQAKQDPVFGPDFAPRLRFESGEHWAFFGPGKNKRLAMAARDDEGNEWLLVNRDAPPGDLMPRIQHELGHLAAWRKYGEGIKEHGPEFREQCRRFVEKKQNAFCKGHE